MCAARRAPKKTTNLLHVLCASILAALSSFERHVLPYHVAEAAAFGNASFVHSKSKFYYSLNDVASTTRKRISKRHMSAVSALVVYKL
jgi:hypothetical protein